MMASARAEEFNMKVTFVSLLDPFVLKWFDVKVAKCLRTTKVVSASFPASQCYCSHNSSSLYDWARTCHIPLKRAEMTFPLIGVMENVN